PHLRVVQGGRQRLPIQGFPALVVEAETEVPGEAAATYRVRLPVADDIAGRHLERGVRGFVDGAGEQVQPARIHGVVDHPAGQLRLRRRSGLSSPRRRRACRGSVLLIIIYTKIISVMTIVVMLTIVIVWRDVALTAGDETVAFLQQRDQVEEVVVHDSTCRMAPFTRFPRRSCCSSQRA